MLSMYSLYQVNKTLTKPVQLINVDLENFFFRPGKNNITIQSEFQRSQEYSVRAALQLGTNYVKNKTLIVVIRDFSTVFAGNKSVPWVNDVLSSVSFVIYLDRMQSLSSLIVSRFRKFKDGVKAGFGDWGWENSTAAQRSAAQTIS
jgi:hypothetical protein